MCGIAGEIRRDGGVRPGPLQDMANGLRHRGPDDEGLWISADSICGMSFRRLSIIDLSRSANQPMVDPETGNVIVFNGEIYNFQALRRDCELRGDKFSTRGDTEVILKLYRHHGTKCLEHLRGMFAFAIWDEKKRSLFFARDRLGKKPFYYAITKQGFIFCSEIASLARHGSISLEQDPEGLELYLQLQYVPAPWTIYRQIRKLPAAHYGHFSVEHGLSLDKYWDLDYRKKIKITENDAIEGLQEQLTEAVRLRLVTDVPLGALLSGGVDSSVVVATMARLAGEPVKTFSVGFEEEQFDEAPYAAEVARICGTDHYPLVAHGDVASMLPRVAMAYGEPFADPSAVPSFLVCEAAREQVTVALNGDGGDELLGGYGRYALPEFSMFLGRVTGGAGVRSATLALRLGSSGTFLGRASGFAMRRLLHPELGSVFNYIAFWNDQARADLLSQANPGALLDRWRSGWFEQSANRAANPVDRMLYFDNHTYLPDDLLVKMDIASMHCGLEARSPLLDHVLVEYCAQLPSSLKVRNGVGKYLLKRLAEQYFPTDFVHRKKMGFAIPLAEWLSGPLRPMMRSILTDRGLMQYFDEAVVLRTLREFDATPHGAGSHAWRLWNLLMYGLWRQGSETMRSERPQAALSL